MTSQSVQPARNVVSPGTHAMTKAGTWSQREADLIARVITKGLSPVELSAFAAVCKHTGLDPFRRQVYAIKRGGVMTVQVAIDGYRSLAARSGEYQGQLGPQWCGPDGEWKDVWLDDKKPPVAARLGVRRKGFPDPLWATATYKEFFVKDSPLWTTHPAHMLAVRAESHALRRCFPETFMAFNDVAAQAGVAVEVEAVADEEIPQLDVGDEAPVETQAGGWEEGAAAAGYVAPSPAEFEAWNADLVDAMKEAKLRPVDLASVLGMPFDPLAIHVEAAARGLDVAGLVALAKGKEK